jgi:hypothetical protein
LTDSPAPGTHYLKGKHPVKRILAAVGVLVLAAAGAAAVVVIRGDAARIRTLQRQDVTLTQQVRSLNDQVTQLGSTVAGINQPSDPLSAYNDVCNQDMQNNVTGADQTYWFPCTNQAQTIPQPGN